MKQLFITTITLIFASTLSAQAQNLLVNGDFSSSTYIDDSYKITYTDIGGWVASSSEIDLSGGDADATYRWNFGNMAQTIQDNSTTTGMVDFSFDYTTTNGGEDITYDIYGIDTDYTELDFHIGNRTWNPTGQETTLLSGSFTASGATTDIFSTTVDFGTGYKHIVLVLGGKVGSAAENLSFDNVYLGAAAVPEPDTYALLLLGGIALFLVIRTRKALA